VHFYTVPTTRLVVAYARRGSVRPAGSINGDVKRKYFTPSARRVSSLTSSPCVRIPCAVGRAGPPFAPSQLRCPIPSTALRTGPFPQEQEIETAETVVLVAAEGRIAHDVRAAQCVVKVERDRAPGGGGGFGKLADAPHMQAATRAEEPSFARPGRRGRLPLRERRKETCSANRGTKCKAEDAGQEATEPFPRSQSPAAAAGWIALTIAGPTLLQGRPVSRNPFFWTGSIKGMSRENTSAAVS